METPTAITTLRKPNSALVMMIRKGKLPATARKIYNVMLAVTQQQLPVLKPGATLLGIDAATKFRAPLSVLVGPAVVGDSDPRTVAKKYLRSMLDISVDWEAPDESTGVIWQGMNMLAQVDLVLNDGVLWVEWALAPSMMLALATADKYTTLELIVNVAPLKTYASVALYEICVRYKNNPTGVTSKDKCEWWIDALSPSAAKIDPDSGLPKVREWRKFKDDVVKDAIAEINEKTDITIQLMEVKVGKRITEVQFSVQKKKLPSHDAVLTHDVAMLATRLDVPLSSLAQLVKGGKHSNAAILLALTKLESRVNNTELGPVDNQLAYLRTVLDDQAKYISSDETQRPTPRPAPVEAPTEVIKTKDWLTARVDELKAELLALPAAEQQEYVAAVQVEQKARGASPAIMKRLATGEWKTQALALNLVVSEYAKQIYGPDWRKEPEPTRADMTLEG